MKQYLNLIREIIEAPEREDRTGDGTVSIFGTRFVHDCQQGFPLMTHKRMSPKSIFAELVWFIKGDSDANTLKQLGSTIWQEWANADGDIGPMYGAGWRGRRGHEVDQLALCLKSLVQNPTSRRMVVSTWRPELLPDETISPVDNVNQGKMALAPCHVLFQFYVDKDTLELQWYQRSLDSVLGAPYNIASYAALLHLFAYLLDLKPGRIIGVYGDTHIYKSHINSENLSEMLSREPKALPELDLSESPLFNELKAKLACHGKDAPLEFFSDILDEIGSHAEEAIRDLVYGVKHYESHPSVKFDVQI